MINLKLRKRLLRYTSIYDYILRIGGPQNWRLSASKCVACGKRGFISFKPTAFMTRCLRCHNSGINLSLIPIINELKETRAIESVWEMSTYGATLNYLNRHFKSVHTSEYIDPDRLGETIGGIRNEDVQDLSFDDESLDLITSNQVFEHVPDDIQGYKECYRVLRPGGSLVFSVPLKNIPETLQRAKVNGSEVEHILPPEYHNARTTGAGSVLTFWTHSEHDICLRVASAGFEVKLRKVTVCSSQKTSALIVVATKGVNV